MITITRQTYHTYTVTKTGIWDTCVTGGQRTYKRWQ
jgi:hypothetical protein